MPRTRNPYPAEFREQMVALVRTGRSVESLAREYEPCAATIHEWVRQATADDGDDPSSLTSAERDELRQLRREVKQLRQERDILFKGRGLVCTKRRDIAQVFEFMTANQAEYPIQMMSRTLGVSRSGFYAYHSRPPSVRQVADEALSKRIATIHKASKETYGAPRIHAELADEGIFVGRKRVERLMLAKGLRGVSRRKFVVTTERNPRVRPAADLVDRNFYADAPNVLWVADITFVPTWAGFLYLAVVLDAFSRRVVGWAMGTRQRTQLVLDAMNMAVTQRKPSSVIHHSDQGSQYTSVAFGLRCKEMGVRPSMGSVGDCYDNAMCESFFATLECELLERRKFRTKAEARVACFEFIEGWYNPSRRHSALGYKSPINYERTAAEGLESLSP
ncbi:IS3 family transposase [Pukyongiella litopenaei]|uniref:IS3 family transposase n=1 Tax=Pukyongiella litopenaei TaxID=2605946 RepID=A0A2S0MR83_9RHOB|nr:IS3 family transposase [Pukyongiella litopenaei]AVO37133.1 IS3 family transposase [Pukyongiella litopenaei]AVO37338.1 IS3 family transposase [Pukyongiella litopenaei]AVO38203.1 IS3 family transposase [Pukyongiella litopenaei]